MGGSVPILELTEEGKGVEFVFSAVSRVGAEVWVGVDG